MTPQDLSPLLARHPFAEGFDDGHLALLLGCARNLAFRDGERVIRSGEPADALYLVRSGRIALSYHGADTHETAEGGEAFGVSWLFPPYRWDLDGSAAGPVRVIKFDGACLRQKCEKDEAFGYRLVSRMLFYQHRRLERAHLALLDVYGGGQK